MERRTFLTKAMAASSACVIAGPAAFASVAPAAETEKKVKCKITVVRREHYKDLYQKYRNMDGEKCPVFKDGQEFVMNNYWECPEGFCTWAWADIRPFVQQMFFGRDSFVSCCSDGYRPVVFKIDRIEE